MPSLALKGGPAGQRLAEPDKTNFDTNFDISSLGGNDIYFGRKLRKYTQVYSTMSSRTLVVKHQMIYTN